MLPYRNVQDKCTRLVFYTIKKEIEHPALFTGSFAIQAVPILPALLLYYDIWQGFRVCIPHVSNDLY